MANTKEYIVAVPKNIHRNTIVKNGREPNMTKNSNGEYEPQPVTYVSDIKERTLFKDEFNIIKFKSHSYITNNQEDIAFIESHPIFGKGIWKNAFPKEIVDKLKRQSEEYRNYKIE